ncbi:MAG: GNAT family N-acetyltransferase [Candidatus Eremiobacteraeota bacterium]|nr:GNAT family N-acetyltransferase [Candidatus Eremiobacteraeota bacterium]
MSDPIVRAARSEDIDPLMAILDAVAAEDLYISTEPGYDRDSRRAFWESSVDGTRVGFFVAVDGTAVVGLVGVYPHAEYGYLLGMMVAPSHRGRRFGAALLDAGIGWVRKRGGRAVHLLVFPHNTVARQMYERRGFKQVDYFPHDVVRRNGDAWDTILMRKELVASERGADL